MAAASAPQPVAAAVAPKVVDPKSFVLRMLPRLAIALAVIVIVFWGILPRFADMAQVWRIIWDMSWAEIGWLIALAAAALCSHGLGIMATTPGRISYFNALTENQTGSAICNLVPAGGAVAVVVNYEQYKSWNLTTEDYTLMVVVSGIWNNFIKLGLPVFAVVILAFTGEVEGVLVLAAVVGLVVLAVALLVFAAALRSEDFARRVGQWAGRVVTWLRQVVHHPKEERWGEVAVQTRAQVIDLVQARWWAMTVTLLLPNILEYLILLGCVRGVGIDSVGWDDVLVAYSVGKLLTVIPLTPGGLGILDLGMIGILVNAGAHRDEVVAAVFVWRGLTFLPTIPVGAVLGTRWWLWNRHRKERLAAAPSA